MSQIESLQKEIEKLKERNRKVEANKAWETSFARKLILFTLTYVVAGITLQTLNDTAPWTHAIIPSIGFFLSTLSIPFLRDIWIKYFYNNN